MPARSAESLLRVLDDLVDHTVGIIHDIEELPREAGAPEFFYYYARSCNTEAFCDQKNFAEGGGASTRRDVALAKAVGEAVERYCPALYCKEELPLTTFRQASFPCVHPSEFTLHSSDQYAQMGFPFKPFTIDTPIRWSQTVELLTGRTYSVPSAMVHIPYIYDEAAGEIPICQPISTGLACHSSFENASISAICEVIERDAFTISWQAYISRPHISVDTLSENTRDLIARLEKNGSTVALVDMTMDTGVPTIFAIASTESLEAPAFVCAASTHLDPEEAARKALEEVAHTRVLAQGLKSNRRAPQPIPPYGEVIDQDSHIRFYGEQSNATLASFLTASQSIDFRSIPNLSTGVPDRDLEILLQRVHHTSHRVLLTDLTTPDVNELGLSVVRAIIPGFHPLFLGHRIRALGGSRLWSLPQKLGHKGISPSQGDNPSPHPYP